MLFIVVYCFGFGFVLFCCTLVSLIAATVYPVCRNCTHKYILIFLKIRSLYFGYVMSIYTFNTGDVLPLLASGGGL